MRQFRVVVYATVTLSDAFSGASDEELEHAANTTVAGWLAIKGASETSGVDWEVLPGADEIVEDKS